MDIDELSNGVIGCCFEVSNDLGCGFLESVYERALLIVLRQRGLAAESQVPLNVQFRGQSVGEFYADIVVNQTIIVELKAVKTLCSVHAAQVLNYIRASDIAAGLLVNFGTPKLEVRRFNNYFEKKRPL
jgi:GxxExxY protein